MEICIDFTKRFDCSLTSLFNLVLPNFNWQKCELLVVKRFVLITLRDLGEVLGSKNASEMLIRFASGTDRFGQWLLHFDVNEIRLISGRFIWNRFGCLRLIGCSGWIVTLRLYALFICGRAYRRSCIFSHYFPRNSSIIGWCLFALIIAFSSNRTFHWNQSLAHIPLVFLLHVIFNAFIRQGNVRSVHVCILNLVKLAGTSCNRSLRFWFISSLIQIRFFFLI